MIAERIFSKSAVRNLRITPNFSTVSGKFEDVDLGGEYDLIYSASAFHWIDEEIGYKKVYNMLKNGSVFTRSANHPYRDKGKPALSVEMDRIYYADYYYKYHKKNRKRLLNISNNKHMKEL